VVAVDLAGICASDVAEWRDGPHVIPVNAPHRLTGQAAPVTLGHEFVGHVTAVGPDVTGVAVGDRVCGDACIRCGRCFWCQRGEYNICPDGGSIGLHTDGAFAALLVVPAYCLYRVPEQVPDRAATAVEPLAVALHALRRVRFEPGDHVVVLGGGMIGASAALLSGALGAGGVHVIEASAPRRELAAGLGVTAVHADAEADTRRAIRRATRGIGADVVLDCTGAAAALPVAVELSRRGGRVGVCGLAHAPAPLRGDRIVYYEREIVGVLGYRFDHPTVIGLLASGRLRVDPLYGEPVPLDRVVPDGLRQMAENPAAPLRIPVRPK
jgi:(R,R)-butanediol dehydrogenase/meso-butanediol dehydrogenase/diacetyl reductase